MDDLLYGSLPGHERAMNDILDIFSVRERNAMIHPISWSPTQIKRVCRATLMAETFGIIKGTEAGTLIRAAIVHMKGELDMRNWEDTAA